ncbi:MAG: hypothetical protein Q8900_03420 [Bacillota bacterium]|nr:hypothetical protein [Bacillota bacterium]
MSVSDKVIQVNKKHFKLVGTISNGKSLTFEIPNEMFEVIVAFSKNFPSIYNTCYTVPSGS